MKKTIDKLGGAPGLLRLIVAIDRAYDGISLVRPRISGELQELVQEWELTGSLERAATEMVLRKGNRWRVGSSLAHYCENLGWVSESSRVVVQRIPQSWWAPSELIREKPQEQDGTIRLVLAFVPMLHDAGDIRFRAVDRGKGRYFVVELETGRQEDLTRTAEDLISRLEKAGVNLAFLPETSVGASLLRALSEAVIRNTQAKLDKGTYPSLRAMIIGGMPQARRNEAIVIGADGGTLLSQPKLQAWNLSAEEQKHYGLGSELGAAVDRREDLEEQGTVFLLDDPGFGRLVVLICEDLARADPARGIVIDSSPTLVVSPLLDGSLAKTRWAYKAAESLAGEPGSLVLISNSFVLSEKRRQANKRKRPRTGVGIAIICHPDDWGQTVIMDAAPAPGYIEVREVTWPRVWGHLDVDR